MINQHLVKQAALFRSQAAHLRAQADRADAGEEFPFREEYVFDRRSDAAHFEAAAIERESGLTGPAVRALKDRGLA